MAAFIRINEERFKKSSVTRYKYDGQSSANGLWYLTIWFGRSERRFNFETKEKVQEVIKYLDKVLEVTEV